jgi:hypothetical protein
VVVEELESAGHSSPAGESAADLPRLTVQAHRHAVDGVVRQPAERVGNDRIVCDWKQRARSELLEG